VVGVGGWVRGQKRTRVSFFYGAFKNTIKIFLQKKPTNPKPIFLVFVYHVLGRFSVRGVHKHHKKDQKKSDPGRHNFT
jgi:hypothetical protein